jgi:hypothetical protein
MSLPFEQNSYARTEWLTGSFVGSLKLAEAMSGVFGLTPSAL